MCARNVSFLFLYLSDLLSSPTVEPMVKLVWLSRYVRHGKAISFAYLAKWIGRFARVRSRSGWRHLRRRGHVPDQRRMSTSNWGGHSTLVRRWGPQCPGFTTLGDNDECECEEKSRLTVLVPQRWVPYDVLITIDNAFNYLVGSEPHVTGK